MTARPAVALAALAALAAVACADDDPTQRKALEDLYNAAGGDGWRNNTGWLTVRAARAMRRREA